MSSQEDYRAMASGDENFEIHGIFPIPVYTRENFIEEKEFPLENLLTLPLTPAHDKTGLYGGVTENTYVLDLPFLWPLKKKIEKYILEYANCVLGLAGEFAITQSWLSVKEPGQKHIMHSHGNSIVSGTFYFNNHEDAAGLTFMKSEISNTYQLFPLRNPNVNNQFSFTEVTLKVENYMLCLFPSYLAHKVEDNKTEHTRYCLAFNAMPKYALGFEKDLTEMEYKRVGREV